MIIFDRERERDVIYFGFDAKYEIKSLLYYYLFG